MAVELLRPSAPGTNCNINDQGGCSACPNHYTCVDEVSADGVSTYVYQSSSATTFDTYALPNHSEGSGDITHVRVYIRVTQMSTDGGARAVIYTHSTPYYGDRETPPTYSTWGNFSKTWTKNPNTGLDWTWDEVDALEAGVGLERIGANVFCTQVYVEVDYTPGAEVDPPTVTTQPVSDIGFD